MNPRFCRLQVVAPGVALLIFSSVGSLLAQPSGAVATVPPAPVMERPLDPATTDVPGEQPTAQHAWVPGHWRWLEGAYVWEAGRWEIPPAAGVVWQAPDWRRESNGWVLREGYWDAAPAAPAVTVVSAGSTPGAEIIVDVPPPPPQREMIVERPSPLHVWVGGHWTWRLGKHVWVSGRWSTAPRTNAVWVGPRWEPRHGRYVYIPGYWRDAVVVVPARPAGPTTVVVAPTAPAEVVVVQGPPPPRVEVVYAPPGPGFIWVKGYWSWRSGRHVWIAGRYERPPRGHHHWVEPRWERRGGRYVFIEGRWGR